MKASPFLFLVRGWVLGWVRGPHVGSQILIVNSHFSTTKQAGCGNNDIENALSSSFNPRDS